MGIVVFGGPARVTVDGHAMDAEARDVVYLSGKQCVCVCVYVCV
jgi:5-keto 4-deoxyuronate isomerase